MQGSYRGRLGGALSLVLALALPSLAPAAPSAAAAVDELRQLSVQIS